MDKKIIPTKCLGCGSPSAFAIYEPKYGEDRGKCLECGSDWPES
jgi:hypothetical protein